jgi:hypothetical protein
LVSSSPHRNIDGIDHAYFAKAALASIDGAQPSVVRCRCLFRSIGPCGRNGGDPEDTCGWFALSAST